MLPEALSRYAKFLFNPSIDESFLASKGAHDQVVYSILRVRDRGLSQELWIRLEESENTFAEIATTFGEGPEASHKGIIGPMSMGSITPPVIANRLRTLRPGQIHPPIQIGEWYVLLRLEKLVPARLDSSMKQFLLDQQLNSLLQDRVSSMMSGTRPSDLDPYI